MREDGKYYSGEYLPANSDLNPANYGQLGIVEHGKDGTVGSILTILAHGEKDQVMIAFVESPGRLGNKGVAPMLESKRASVDNVKVLETITKSAAPVIDLIYSNNARITGDQPKGAPINAGTLVLNELSPDFNWKPIADFARECQESMSLASAFKSLAYLGVLNNLTLPSQTK